MEHQLEKIILNEHLRQFLPDLSVPREVCDESGRTIGHFIPKKPWEPKWTEEEIREIMKGPDFSTEDVIRHLESL